MIPRLFSKTLLTLSLAICSIYGRTQTLVITTCVGKGTTGYSGNGGPADSAQLSAPAMVTFDASGNMYFSDNGNSAVRKVSAAGIITTVAGNDTPGYYGDNGPATSAKLNGPVGVAVDNAGNLYIADQQNNVIRKVNTSGIITTIAGDGTAGFKGEGGRADTAELNIPSDLVIDNHGNLLVSDRYNSVIRKIDLSTGIISTIAGIPDSAGYTGNGGPAMSAKIGDVVGMTIDHSGNLYIAESFPQHIIRKIDTAGIITLFAGDDSATFGGDGIAATATSLSGPGDIVVDDSGNVYFSEPISNVIRKVNTAGILSTYAGDYLTGFAGDNGIPTLAKFNEPLGLAFDNAGSMYITDVYNSRIRKIRTSGLGVAAAATPENGIIYPNPCNGTFRIRGMNRGYIEVTVTNIVGQPTYQLITYCNGGDMQVVMPGVPPAGVYLVAATTTAGKKTFMLQITR